MNDTNPIISAIDEQGILNITFNRPDKLNSLSSDVLDKLSNLFTDARQNPEVKAVLLTGQGKAFCAGADIKRLADLDGVTGLAFAKQGQDIFRNLETLGKPSLCAINGFTFGGGCELAMSASMRIASDNAMFGQPEVKLGVIPGYGGTQRLARLVGKGRAIDLCITGRFISAKDALQWGLISEVTSCDELLPRAKEILHGILAMAPLAVAHTLEVIDQGFDMPLEAALQLEAERFGQCCDTQDHKEGVNAFLEKRSAQFVGE